MACPSRPPIFVPAHVMGSIWLFILPPTLFAQYIYPGIFFPNKNISSDFIELGSAVVILVLRSIVYSAHAHTLTYRHTQQRPGYWWWWRCYKMGNLWCSTCIQAPTGVTCTERFYNGPIKMNGPAMVATVTVLQFCRVDDLRAGRMAFFQFHFPSSCDRRPTTAGSRSQSAAQAHS